MKFSFTNTFQIRANTLPQEVKYYVVDPEEEETGYFEGCIIQAFYKDCKDRVHIDYVCYEEGEYDYIYGYGKDYYGDTNIIYSEKSKELDELVHLELETR